MKVFISSTFIDLEDLRSNTLEFFKKFAITPLAMEVWSSSTDDPITKCLIKVRECDLFIGIYGQRYGFIPEGHDKSITELEYIEAKKYNVDTLLFVMGDDYPIPVKYVDRGDKYILLNSFKNELKNNHYLSFFSSLTEFNNNLSDSFRDYLNERDIDMKDLNFKSLYDELEELYEDNRMTKAFKMDSNNLDNMKVLLSELDRQIQGLKKFHDYISKSYNILESDFYRIVNSFGITKEMVDEKYNYKENPFKIRDWEMITFFPNRIIELEKVKLSFELIELNRRAEKEAWSEELLEEIKAIKENLKNHLLERGYID